MRLWSIWLILAVLAPGGCSEPETVGNHRAAGMSHLSQGDPETALTELRAAIQQSPEDPELRLMAARAYLMAGRGDLAEVSLDQALARGLEPMRALPLRARALQLQGRHAAVQALVLPDDAPEEVHLAMLFEQTLARAAQTDPTRLDHELTRAFQQLFDLLAEPAPSPEVTGISGELATLRSTRAEVERAWQHHRCAFDPVGVVGWLPIDVADRRILRVGPSRKYATPAEAAAVARDGDVVEIDSGRYEGGVALWRQSRIVVRGLGHARPLITASGRAIEDRDVWLFTGDDVTVENVVISGARSAFRNGAGIRHTGRGLTLRHVILRDNENGLLTGHNWSDSDIVIEHTEFDSNGDGEGQAHNIYVGRAGSLELRFSYSHGVQMGHLVKSRARANTIAYNRLADVAGTSSYLIDIPEGGSAIIIGNELYQGPNTPNHGMISFGAEGLRHETNELVVASNSVYNQHFRGVLVRNRNEAGVRLVNNLIGGAPVGLADGPYEESHTLTLPDHGMADPRSYDFALTGRAQAVDAGGPGLEPEFEYVHPLRYRPRARVWALDVGAHERCGLR